MMRVLIACEFSGIVRDAFDARGHLAVSCDLLPSEKSGIHYQGDVRDILDWGWDLMIAHPPCTYLAASGARWFKDRMPQQKEALDFIRLLLNAPISKIALENPVGIISTKIQKPNQIIQPWMFGHEASKRTCLWLKGLPLLVPVKVVGVGEMTIHKSGKKTPKWYADTYHLPTKERRMERSRTFQGIADAMAEQWG